MFGIGLIGCGYWGKNLLRNLHKTGYLCSICDRDRYILEKRKLKGLKITTNSDDILNDSDITAVVIATPTSTHYELTKQALKNNKHVLVEKPFVTDYDKAIELHELAKKKNLKLMIGLEFMYNSAIHNIKEIIESDLLGDVQYIELYRKNFGKIRHNINAWWNLAPHDISILYYLFESEITSLTSVGYNLTENKQEDIVKTNLKIGNIDVSIESSWLCPEKLRGGYIVGTKGMLKYDEMAPDNEKVIYNNNEIVKKRAVKGNKFYSDINFKEPLKEEINNFINCIENNKKPIANSNIGVKTVKILEVGQKSINLDGKRIKIL